MVRQRKLVMTPESPCSARLDSPRGAACS